MSSVTRVASVAMVAGLLAVVPAPGPAGAAGVGVTSVHDVVVDQARGRIYVSGGALATTDLNGTPQGTVAGVSAARQLAFTPDGSQLVVANADGLTVVDAATATVVRTIPTGANSCPDAVAPAAGKVFFTYGDCPDGTPGLGAVDLTDDSVATGISTGSIAVEGGEGSTQSVVLKPVPGATDALVLVAGPVLAVLDATGGPTPTVAVRASRTVPTPSGAVAAVSPDGAEVVVGTSTLQLLAYSTTDLEPLRTFPVARASSLAYRADGRLATSPGYRSEVGLFAPGSVTGKPLKFVPAQTTIPMRGLAYGAVNLYAVLRNGSTYSVVRAPVGPAATISVVADKWGYAYKATAIVTIKLTSPTTSRTVSLWVRPYGGAFRLVKTGAVSTSTRTLVVKVPGLIRNTTFQARFAGDEEFAPSTATRDVPVRAKLVISSRSRSTSNGFHRLPAKPAPVLIFQVLPHHPNQCLRISGQLLVKGKWRDLVDGGLSACKARTNANSRFALRLVGFKRGDRVRISGRYSDGGLYGQPKPGGAGNIESTWVRYLVVMT